MSGNYDQWELKPDQPKQFGPVSGGSGSSTRNGLIWALVAVVAIVLVAVLGSLVWGVKTERISLPFGNQTQVSSSSVAETPAEETATKTATATVTETTVTKTQTETQVQREREPGQRESSGIISSVETSREPSCRRA